MDDEIEAALDAALQRASTDARIPWTDEGIPVFRAVAAQIEINLTEEQRETLTAAMSAMTPEDWDAFATSMFRPVQPDVDGC